MVETIRRTIYPMRNYYQTSAIEECTPDFPHREIKRIGVKQAPDVACLKMVFVLRPRKEAQDIIMRNHYSFGHTSRATSIDDVGQMVWTAYKYRILAGKTGNL